MAAVPTLRFASNPRPLPILGFGCGTALYTQDPKESLNIALKAGFRFLDLAEAYKNSQYVGASIAQSGCKDDLYVLTKIAQGIKDAGGVVAAAKEEIRKLGIKQLDACLLHLPPRGNEGGWPSNVEAWKQMQELKEQGLAKTIGVSNWLAHDLQEVIDSKPKHPIEMNEIELHPIVYADKRMQDSFKVMRAHDIRVLAFGSLVPLTRGDRIADNKVLPAAEAIAAAKPGRSAGTVLLKWAAQRGEGAVITTTNRESRAREYLDAFTEGKGYEDKLSEDELRQLDEAGAQSTPIKAFMTGYWQ